MYQMAAYCRLSKDDGENKISESIENQMKLIREYVGKSNDLEIADIYIDDGYSGLYFANRPEFQRMMEDIYKGKIQGVITKDISRLGREHIETSNYIERFFPSLGVRYIAILDGVDSAHHSNEELAGVPEEVAKEALRLAMHKLPCKCKIVSSADLEGGDNSEN